jgi:hypothetical protein
MQIEKHHQLDLDETSQQVLEGLQQQINDIDLRDAEFSSMLDGRLEDLLEQVQEDVRAEKFVSGAQSSYGIAIDASIDSICLTS